MRILNFLFTISLVVCYSVPFGSAQVSLGSQSWQCHADMQSGEMDEMPVSQSDSQNNSQSDTDGDRIECCHPSLLNAPTDFNYDGGSFIFISTLYEFSYLDVETFEYIDKSFYIKQRFGPPDIFLTKSVFLL